MCYIYIILCLDENYTFQIEYCKIWVLLLRLKDRNIATSTVFGQELLQVYNIPFDKYQYLPSTGNLVSSNDFLLIACQHSL